MTSALSVGGVSVHTRRLSGGGVADCPGALRGQQGPGLHRGPGGEAPEEARGLREVHRHVGGAVLCAGAPHHGIVDTVNVTITAAVVGGSDRCRRSVAAGADGTEEAATGYGRPHQAGAAFRQQASGSTPFVTGLVAGNRG